MRHVIESMKVAMLCWTEAEWYAFVILVSMLVWLLIARPLHFIGA